MKYFGTDGIRGKYGDVITLDLSKFAALGLSKLLKKGQTIIISADTRESSADIVSEMSLTLLNCGINVVDLGVMPTPVVSLMIKEVNAAAGIMISASHNPYYDNGIKMFGSNGMKINDEWENVIEEVINDCKDNKFTQSEVNNIGKYQVIDPTEKYLKLLKNITKSLSGLKVGLDCANGASFKLAKEIFLKLGAKITVIGDEPNGVNINNEIGSLYPEKLAKIVVGKKLDVGFCFDGDADRIVCIDNLGNILSGDHILYLLGKEFKKKDKLVNTTIVATSMSNLGFLNALSNLDIKVKITDVGDRYVIKEMKEGNYNLGGEQSGHIILSDYITTGDGILTSIMISALLIKDKDIFNKLEKELIIFPQKLINIKVSDKKKVINDPELLKIIKTIELKLGNSGRILVRSSGTEELVRIMMEASDNEKLDKYINTMVEFVKNKYEI